MSEPREAAKQRRDEDDNELIPLPFMELLEIALRLGRCIRCGEASEAERRDIFLRRTFCAQCVKELHEEGAHYPRLMEDLDNGDERHIDSLKVWGK